MNTQRWLAALYGRSEPGADVQQRAILAEALATLAQARVAGSIVDLPYRWKRSIYRDPLGRA